MERDIQIFKNENFGEVRVVEINGEPMFCLTDLCQVLGLKQFRANERLTDDVISNHPIIDNLGRTFVF